MSTLFLFLIAVQFGYCWYMTKKLTPDEYYREQEREPEKW